MQEDRLVGQPVTFTRRVPSQKEPLAMKNNRNRQVILKSRPADIPQADNFEIIESDVPELRDGQLLVHNHYLSVEPAMRGWVSNVANYSEPVRIGEVMRAFAAGEVL
jgi:NADPH-dependent curcumin reductase CurA